ncbi:ALF repeat-containing protein [Streptomyces albireticuli]|nr:ALF repeat-containing protein [Streptomyces albireticuli]MCD9161455.1 ALF repeat-containing protein [Streptomyces albireticuli]MCD9192975.1 ALF repeat-containing protein [Streptomyces albireticuli]
MKTRGPWSQAAAKTALTGSDEAVRSYLRTGWQQAAAQDQRAQVQVLAVDSEYESLRKAAAEALKGDAKTISEFLRTGGYEAALTDYRVQVTKIMGSGGPELKSAAQTALRDGSAGKLVDFLREGQYTAQVTDDRIRATQLMGSGGPETQAMAKIVLQGTDEALHEFIQVGQYATARGDHLTATHVAFVQQLIAEAAGTAATAQKNAAEAAVVAAKANDAADQAQRYADEALKAAGVAEKSAAQADGYANQAEASAADAAKSARTADAAATAAEDDAAKAEYSATRAMVSAELASSSAQEAYASAGAARASAEAAGKDADAAEEAHRGAIHAYEIKLAEAEALRRAQAEVARASEGMLSNIERWQLENMRLSVAATGEPDAWILGLEWITGTGKETHHYGADDRFTKQLRGDHSMDAVRNTIREKIAKGIDSDGGVNDGYSVGKEGFLRFGADALYVRTFGLSGQIQSWWTDGKYGTQTSTFVGSYDYEFQVVSRNSQRGKAEVKITIRNKTDINSLTHYPKIRRSMEKYVGHPLDATANWLGGPFRTKWQEASWIETMDVS